MRDQSEYDFSASKILRIENTGQVYWTQLLRPILFCEMQLDNYPIGHQICPLKLASVGREEVEAHQLISNFSSNKQPKFLIQNSIFNVKFTANPNY